MATANVLREADKFLLRGGLTRSAQLAKFARAMGVGTQDRAAGQPAERALSASSPAGEVITGYLAEQVATMKALDPAVRGDQPDAVHQMRIAVRKLRSTLRTFGRLIWRQNVQPVADELKWLGTELGGARDAEVLHGHLRSSVDTLHAELVLGPIKARIQGHFAHVSAQAKETLTVALRSQRYFELARPAGLVRRRTRTDPRGREARWRGTASRRSALVSPGGQADGPGPADDRRA